MWYAYLPLSFLFPARAWKCNRIEFTASFLPHNLIKAADVFNDQQLFDLAIFVMV